MNQILVGIDDSENAQRAFEWALRLAKATGAGLVLLHASWPVFVSPRVQPALWAELESVARRQADALLAKFRPKADTEGVRVLELTVFGSASQKLAEASDSPEVQMVVVGSRGRGAVSSAMLGSTSRQLVHDCKKPVLVVP